MLIKSCLHSVLPVVIIH